MTAEPTATRSTRSRPTASDRRRPPAEAPRRRRARLGALLVLALLAGAVGVRAQTSTPPTNPGTVIDPVDKDRFKSGGGGGGILPPNMGTGKPPTSGVGPKGTGPLPNPITPKSPLGRLLEVPGSSSGGSGGGGGGGGDPPPEDDGTGPTTSDPGDGPGPPGDEADRGAPDAGAPDRGALRGWVVERAVVEDTAAGRCVTWQLVGAAGARLVVVVRRGPAAR